MPTGNHNTENGVFPVGFICQLDSSLIFIALHFIHLLSSVPTAVADVSQKLKFKFPLKKRSHN